MNTEKALDNISKGLSDLANANEVELSWQIQGYVDALFSVEEFSTEDHYPYNKYYNAGWASGVKNRL